MDYETLRLRQNDNVAVIEFARPDVMNALNTQMRAEILHAVKSAENGTDRRKVNVKAAADLRPVFVRTSAGNLRAHGIQAVGQVHHLGLTSRVLDDGRPFGKTRRHHQVFRARDGDQVHHQASPF